MRSQRGFTLIELLCVIAIVSILAIVSVGQYSRVSLRSKVQLGRSCVAQISLALARASGVQVPSLVCVSQLQPEYFTFSAQRDATTAVLTVSAVPVEALVGQPCAEMALSDDGKCATLGINAQGVRSASGSYSATPEQCW